MCDRIREDDERTQQMKKNEKLNKCLDINKELEKCLQVNNRDFRKCKEELNKLKECMNYSLDSNNKNK